MKTFKEICDLVTDIKSNYARRYNHSCTNPLEIDTASPRIIFDISDDENEKKNEIIKFLGLRVRVSDDQFKVINNHISK